jgi:hypothetical protein
MDVRKVVESMSIYMGKEIEGSEIAVLDTLYQTDDALPILKKMLVIKAILIYTGKWGAKF